MLVIDQLQPLVSYRSNVIHLAGNKSYRALICGRIVQAGVKENLLNLSANGSKAWQDFEKIIPMRGNVISDKNMYKAKYGSIPSNKVLLDDWYNANKNIVDVFYKFVDNQDRPSLISQIWTKFLLGWHGTIGEETSRHAHSKFGWEYLPYRK